MLFDNRPPINLDNAEKLAEAGRDDWKRMQAWKLEIHNARLAADPDYAARQNTIPEGTT